MRAKIFLAARILLFGPSILYSRGGLLLCCQNNLDYYLRTK